MNRTMIWVDHLTVFNNSHNLEQDLNIIKYFREKVPFPLRKSNLQSIFAMLCLMTRTISIKQKTISWAGEGTGRLASSGNCEGSRLNRCTTESESRICVEQSSKRLRTLKAIAGLCFDKLKMFLRPNIYGSQASSRRTLERWMSPVSALHQFSRLMSKPDRELLSSNAVNTAESNAFLRWLLLVLL